MTSIYYANNFGKKNRDREKRERNTSNYDFIIIN